MGEEEKKPEEKKVEEKKPPAEEKKEQKEEVKEKEEKKEEKKDEKEKAEEKEPPPPEEIVLRVFMHCEGCARKVKRCLRGFEGVEDVQTDSKTHKVVVKGKKADPLKVLDRVQRKSHRKVELLTPLPKPPAEDAKKPEAEKPKAEEKEPPVIIVLLKVHMHCEACAQEIRKRILKMKGVQEADPDLKGSQVTVKGVFEASKLVEYVYKRTGKHATIVKQEPEKKEEEKPKENKEEKAKEGEKEKGGEEAAKAEKKGGEETKDGGGGAEEETKTEQKKNEFIYYNHPRYYTEYQRYPTDYAYPPQMFSDENPNACSVM
ncbi:heavy metal-associated isoprenylated plant protein 7-like [Aristolochia californica]|uniref:heavy metal-associated isoprenylated plant protein 7-like n=1 Tax=Aristolochia californica TaxID=171875 RepID=UPI0035D99B5E